jgi:hypothetical protein
VRWTGSAFLLDNASVNGDPGTGPSQVRRVSGAVTSGGLPPGAPDTTVDAAGANFSSSDLGKTLAGSCVAPGTQIIAVNSATQVTIAPPSIFDSGGATCSLVVGPSLVSESNPHVLDHSDVSVFPGVHYVFNVVDSTSPSYSEARALVGFDPADTSGASTGPLCRGDLSSAVASDGFLPLPVRPAAGGNPAVTCRHFTP